VKRLFSGLVGAFVLGLVVPAIQSPQVASADAVQPVERGVEAVVMTGQQFPTWSRLPAEGVATPNPLGVLAGRNAHAGVLQPLPDVRSGVPADEIAGYRWNGTGWTEVPVQVDQRFPYFLANQPSNFSTYSWTDEELTYQWDDETWMKTDGQCFAQHPAGQPKATQDPVPTFDDDDELSFYASDGGPKAPANEPAPHGAVLSMDPTTQPGFQPRQEIALVDPLHPANVSYVYLFLNNPQTISEFNASNGYVQDQRDGNADEWIDRYSFTPDDPEKLGTSNTGYGPNLHGTVCRTAQVDPKTLPQPDPTNPNRVCTPVQLNGTVTPDGQPRCSTDRFPRDGMTVSTRSYQVHASGRWMVRSTQVSTARQDNPTYGPDLIDRWKGRAFQQSPDSTISLVGFEDEQVNWEANSALLGERAGPVRAIREVWGADSGTNVTKTEYYYRDYYVYRYHLRVHPIPPDGLYTSWDNNKDVAVRYFDQGMTDEQKPGGVSIDGANDDVGNIDSDPVSHTQPMYFDVTDPNFAEPLSFYNWEQVTGADRDGSLVYMFQLNDVKDVEEPLIIPYYRDDKCLDDGTGDDPVARPWPGEASTDPRVVAGYGAGASCENDQKQGAWGAHGIHYLFTSDTDNLWQPKATTEVDGQQYVWAAPSNATGLTDTSDWSGLNVGARYANTVKFALEPIVSAQSATHSTQLQNTGPTSGEIGHDVTVQARLTDESDQPVAGKTVSFSLDGSSVGSSTTDSSGLATATFTVPGPSRQAALTESFAGDPDHGGSSTTVPFTIETKPTTLTNTGATSGELGDQATLSAHLADDDGTPVSGKDVDFALDGHSVGVGTTDDQGNASVQTTLSGSPRTAQLTETFADGDDTYGGTSTSASFVVSADATQIKLSLAKSGSSVQATAVLTDADTGELLSGKTIAFSVNGSAAGTATTDQNGQASRLVKAKKGQTVRASFAGDGTYGSSSAQQTYR
jgi:hypothetical protein